ncbi:HD domain-containing protein [candidate division WOR-3 bacterium]|uniref:HD domain-containing protein n=1 Tax=candidate division WOR-3 bacterium TaxID=2052148 RepID=A0A9D5K9J2_UNCW3|nr:HD domain-containing protein [candidate division WOR-3 bacterium]MBD3364912.1 HD domain-containing protein [candidate division WOR-3 bacterium]
MDSITRNEARKLIRDAGLGDSLIKHSEGVARRAESVARMLASSGHILNLELIVVGAILHDIGLVGPHGLDHGKASADLLEEYGLVSIAALVREHVFPLSSHLPLEAKILAYANLTTGPEGEPVDYEKKLGFLYKIAYNWRNGKERFLALKALDVKRKIVQEIEELVHKAMVGS